MSKLNISEQLLQTRIIHSFLRDVPTSGNLQCADGYTMSVQASEFHYCSPRTNGGPWSSFEIAFPSEVEPLLSEYAEDPDRLTETVYGYVPSAVVLAIVEKHGGLA